MCTDLTESFKQALIKPTFLLQSIPMSGINFISPLLISIKLILHKKMKRDSVSDENRETEKSISEEGRQNVFPSLPLFDNDKWKW